MNRSVIIVDDDNFTLYINQEILEPIISTTWKTFLGAKAALVFLEAYVNEESQLLIFLDLNMPVMNGWQFLDELKTSKFQANIFVVIVTSSIDQRDSFRALEYPYVHGFISKPLEEKTVLALAEIPQLSFFFK